MKIYWCLTIPQITLNKKSRKTPEGISRLFIQLNFYFNLNYNFTTWLLNRGHVVVWIRPPLLNYFFHLLHPTKHNLCCNSNQKSAWSIGSSEFYTSPLRFRSSPQVKCSSHTVACNCILSFLLILPRLKFGSFVCLPMI